MRCAYRPYSPIAASWSARSEADSVRAEISAGQAGDPHAEEFFYFWTGEDANAGFFLAERDFVTAEWNAERTVLAVGLGPVTLMVEPEEEAL